MGMITEERHNGESRRELFVMRAEGGCRVPEWLSQRHQSPDDDTCPAEEPEVHEGMNEGF